MLACVLIAGKLHPRLGAQRFSKLNTDRLADETGGG
jgi:hypothetical protein